MAHANNGPVRQILLEDISNKICFFHIYSIPQDDEISLRVRRGQETFRFGIYPIDATNQSEEEIINLVLSLATLSEIKVEESVSKTQKKKIQLQNDPVVRRE